MPSDNRGKFPIERHRRFVRSPGMLRSCCAISRQLEQHVARYGPDFDRQARELLRRRQLQDWVANLREERPNHEYLKSANLSGFSSRYAKPRTSCQARVRISGVIVKLRSRSSISSICASL